MSLSALSRGPHGLTGAPRPLARASGVAVPVPVRLARVVFLW